MSVHVGKAWQVSVNVLPFTQTWQLSYQHDIPWSCLSPVRASELLTKITADFPSANGCRIWLFVFLVSSL